MGRSKDAIRCFLRLRPHDNKKGGSTGRYELQHTFDDSTVSFHLDRRTAEDFGVNSSREDFTFRFDRIFDQNATQEEVFEAVAKECCQNVLSGYNSTVFAYGQTGSGKTFSITGGTAHFNERGLIPRCISMIFGEAKKNPSWQWNVSVSYLQIYNDKGQDLLNRGEDARSLEDLPVVTYQETEDDVVLKGLESHTCATTHDALNMLFLGDTNRLYTETSMNKTSTRSHCVFSIIVEAREPGTAVVRRSKLNLVDLAGSERVARTGATGTLLTEAKYINLSLHYLEHVITALAKHEAHVPYRNSFLTMVLRDSLGGNCKTAMLATGHLGEQFLIETVSTCRFAQRVALIKQKAFVNEATDPAVLIRQLRQEVAQLKDQVAFLSGGAGADPGRTLTGDEQARCKEAVQRFLNDADPNAQITGVAGDLARVMCCFRILKDLAQASGGSAARLATPVTPSTPTTLAAGPGAADPAVLEQLRRLQTAVQQKENELSLLFQVVERHNAPKSHAAVQTGMDMPSAAGGGFSTLAAGPADRPAGLLSGSVMGTLRGGMLHADVSRGPVPPAGAASVPPAPTRQQVANALEAERLSEGYNLAALDDPGLLTDRAVAFEAFRKSWRKFEQIQKSEAELEQRIPDAKRLAMTVNALIDELKAAKRKVQQLRAERALTTGGELAEADAGSEEAHLMAQIQGSLRPKYDESKKGLEQAKERIEHIQLMMKRTQEQLIKDFEAWFNIRQSQVAQAQGRGVPAGSPASSSVSASSPAGLGASPMVGTDHTRVHRSQSGAAFTHEQHLRLGQTYAHEHLRVQAALMPGTHGYVPAAAAAAAADGDDEVAADLARMYKARDEMRAKLLAGMAPAPAP